MSWHDTRRMLHEDHRWRLTKLLDKSEKQRLFEEHIATLTRRTRELFRRVVDDFVNPVDLMTITYRDVRKLIKDDPRFSKFSSSDRVYILCFLFVCCLWCECFDDDGWLHHRNDCKNTGCKGFPLTYSV